MQTNRRMGRAESGAIATAIALAALVVLNDQWNESKLAHVRSLVSRHAEWLGRLEGKAASSDDELDPDAVPRVRDVRDPSVALTSGALGADEMTPFEARAGTLGVALQPALETVRFAANAVAPAAEQSEPPQGASLARAIAIERERLAADEHAASRLAQSGRLMHGAALGLGLALLLFACSTLRRDVKRGTRNQRGLREREWRVASALDAVGDAVIVIDHDARVLHVNRSAANLSSDDAIGRPLALAFSFTGGGAASAIARALTGERGAALVSPVAADGCRRPLALHAAPLYDEDGSVLGAVIVCSEVGGENDSAAQLAEKKDELSRAVRERDDTQRALDRSDERLRQAQKYETLGNVAGSVAHDFNNLLSVILSYGELLQRSLPSDSPGFAEAEQITRAGKRAAELTRQLLAFSRQELPAVATVDLGASLESVRHTLEHLLGEDIGLDIRAPLELAPVRIDPCQLEQVLLNLSLNARDAMPLGGTLSIEACDVVIEHEADTEHPGVEPGAYVRLSVDDTGTGMDASVQARIFEPFFTTKQRGKGTGLGLSTVFGIVKQSGGMMRVDSTLGRGTTFHLYFPRAHVSDACSHGPRALTADCIESGTETVLLVEDDEQVRGLAQSVLERSGYRVLAANGGEEALRVERGWNGPIHVLVTDVVMPHMSGRQLAEQLGQWRPRMRVLFMSGYADEKVMPHGVLQAGIHLLHKPLTPDALARKVREVLDCV